MSTGVVSSIYDSTFSSMYDFDLPYQVKDKLFQRYGKGQFFTDFLRKTGGEFTYSGNLPLNAHEEGWIEETFTTTGASTGGASAGAVVYVTVDPSCVNSEGQIRPRLYETVFHKHTDNKVYQLQITAISDASVSVSGSSVATYTLTLKPLNSALTVGTGGIADGTELSLGATKFAEYTNHPASTARAMYRRQFYDTISKEGQVVTGVELGTAHWYEQLMDGYKSVWSKIYAEKEFLLDKQIDYEFFLGEENSNSVTMADKDSVSRSVKGTKGIWKWMDELAGSLTYGTSDFDFFTLDDISTYMRSQGVFSKNFFFGVGPDLYTKIENGALDFLADYSSTDLTSLFSQEGTAKTGFRNSSLGMTFKALEKDGNKLILAPIDTFGNIKGLGNSTYDFAKAGFIVPMGNTSRVDGIGEVNNISIGYNVHQDVNRKRVIEMLPGPTGKAGLKAVQAYDGIELLMLSQYMAFIMKVNQTMQVLPYDSY